MALILQNNAISKLAAGIASGATSLTVTAGEGAKFPALGGGDWFPLTLLKPDNTLEIVRCTARAGDVFTITRAQEGTGAIAFVTGDRVELRLTKAAMAQFWDAGNLPDPMRGSNNLSELTNVATAQANLQVDPAGTAVAMAVALG
jgi:hypothetical protein